MSRENEQLARRAYEAATRQPPDFDTVNSLFAPDHEIDGLIERVEGGTASGANGFRDWLMETNELWEHWEGRIEHIRSAGDDRVLVESTFTGVSRRAGVPIEQPILILATVRNGRITRSEVYSSREQALEAAGLD